MSSNEIPTVSGRRVFHGEPPMHFETVYDALEFALAQLAQTIEAAANGRPTELLIPQMRICADLVRLCAQMHETFNPGEYYAGQTQGAQ